MEDNAALQRSIVARLRRDGPLRTQDLEDVSQVPWESTGWTAARNVQRMLDFLLAQGKAVVAGRTGAVRWWADAATWWPAGTPRRLIRERVEELFGFRYRLALCTPRPSDDTGISSCRCSSGTG